MNPKLVLAILSCLVFPASAMGAACSAEDRREMRKEGLSRQSIERLCTTRAEDDDDDNAPRARSRSASGQQTRVSNRCMTPVIACYMGVSGPVGTPCWCATPYGPATGQVQ